MPFKDKEKNRAYNRERLRRWRAQNREANRAVNRKASTRYRQKQRDKTQS